MSEPILIGSHVRTWMFGMHHESAVEGVLERVDDAQCSDWTRWWLWSADGELFSVLVSPRDRFVVKP